MNRRQKIIVSITGIFIVLLALVGLTYAYFLTRITGNSNEKSISVTTANLELVYGDGTTTILEPDTALIPSSTEVGTKDFTVTNNGENTSYTVLIEDTVTKYATAGSYKAADGSTITYEANDPTEFVSNDFRYTLTCTITSSDETRNGTSCNGIAEQKLFPIDGGVITSNNIVKGDVHTYELKFWYIDTGHNQSKDMNKTYNAKVNIVDIRKENPYAVGEETEYEKSLAYNIINNALLKTNGTELRNTPITDVGEKSATKYESGIFPIVSANESYIYAEAIYTYSDKYNFDEKTGIYTLVNPKTGKFTDIYLDLPGKYILAGWATTGTENTSIVRVLETTIDSISGEGLVGKLVSEESVLSVTSDDYGTSYYYRGGVTDNYVNFAGMCWKIVRIQGDGSVKLILEDATYECDNESFTGNWINGEAVYFSNPGIKFLDFEGGLADSFKTFQETLSTKISNTYTDKILSDKLKIDEWCYDDTVTSTNNDRDYYGANTRIQSKTPTLNCNGTKLTKFRDNTDMYVGTLTADEIVYSGLNNTTYLNNSTMNCPTYSSELVSCPYTTTNGWWLLSPNYLQTEDMYTWLYAYLIDYKGDISSYYNLDSFFSRPAVSLKSGIQITKGDGTIGNPYVIG